MLVDAETCLLFSDFETWNGGGNGMVHPTGLSWNLVGCVLVEAKAIRALSLSV